MCSRRIWSAKWFPLSFSLMPEGALCRRPAEMWTWKGFESGEPTGNPVPACKVDECHDSLILLRKFYYPCRQSHSKSTLGVSYIIIKIL